MRNDLTLDGVQFITISKEDKGMLCGVISEQEIFVTVS